jgi:Niemann-Pick C1 protein
VFFKLLKIIFQFLANISNEIVEFGPAYEKEFLLQVFDLQMQIEDLGQSEGEGLEKICFAPMTQVDEKTKLYQCTIQSILGYFKNSIEVFNTSENYLKTIDTCTQNAYGLQCL